MEFCKTSVLALNMFIQLLVNQFCNNWPVLHFHPLFIFSRTQMSIFFIIGDHTCHSVLEWSDPSDAEKFVREPPQHHGCWCPGSLQCQAISNHGLILISLDKQGPVSQTFCKLSKIISWKYTILGITFMMRISSWNFVHVPKAWLWAHVHCFSLKFS